MRTFDLGTPGKVAAGQGFAHKQLRVGTREADLAPKASRFRANLDQMIGRPHDGFFVFHHHYSVAALAEFWRMATS